MQDAINNTRFDLDLERELDMIFGPPMKIRAWKPSKSYNKGNIMRRAHAIRKDKNVSMAIALRRAWALEKAEMIESDMFLIKMSDFPSCEERGQLGQYGNEARVLREQVA